MLISFLGCAHVESYIDIAKEKGVSNEYLDEMCKWTREKKIYSQFDTILYIVATYKSIEFKQAYLKEYSRLYSLSKTEEEKREAVLSELSSDFTEFYFYAYNPDHDAIDFSKPNSIWKIFLVDEKGRQIYPAAVNHIKKITPLVENFYPYINQYHGKFYYLRFPPQKSGKLKLVFTSVLGKAELEWR